MCGLTPKKIYHVSPDTMLSRAWLLLEHPGADVLPVLDGTRKVGLLHRADLAHALQGGPNIGPSKVEDCMRSLLESRVRILVYSSRPTERHFFDHAA